MRVDLRESGLKQAMNMKEETIIKRYNDLGSEPKETLKKVLKVEITITKEDSEFFTSIGLDVEWLASIANQYNFDRFVYASKFKAFRCYRGNNQLDWVSVNDLSLVNIKKEITTITVKHQLHSDKTKAIISFPWRKI